MAIEEEKNILTIEGEQELRKELTDLIEVKRPEVISEIKDAREQGDLSENAEFDAAREKQGIIEDRITEIESILANSTLLSTKVSSSSSRKVRVGSKVTIRELSSKSSTSEETYYIVGSLEANPFENKISNVSPLAIAILGASLNEEVVVEVAKRYKVKIIDIE